MTATPTRLKWWMQCACLAGIGLVPDVALALPPRHHVFGMPWFSEGFIEGAAQLVALFAFVIALSRYRQRPGGQYARAVALFTLASVLIWELVWNLDVLYISWRAHELCKREGGLHVYKVVEADGFLGDPSIDYWSQFGFEFTEVSGKRYDGTLRIVRYFMENGKVNEQVVDAYKSQYEYVEGSEESVGYRIARRRIFVENIETKEVLGDLITFGVGAGIFDSFFISILPAEWTRWDSCDEAEAGQGVYDSERKSWIYGPLDLIKATLKPRSGK